VIILMPAAVPVQEVHQWTREQDQIWDRGKDVHAMPLPQQHAQRDRKRDEDPAPAATRAVSAPDGLLMRVAHNAASSGEVASHVPCKIVENSVDSSKYNDWAGYGGKQEFALVRIIP
jgi:hypothetical protein